MDIRNLQIFVAVVRHGSHAAAARELGMPASQVSRAMAALEDELEQPLLQRTNRRLVLTAVGVGYHDHVLGVLEAVDGVHVDAPAAPAGRPAARVRIAAPLAWGQTVLMPLLPALHDRHPELEIDLRLADAAPEPVAEDIDIALGLAPQDTTLAGVRLAAVRHHVCASPAWLDREGRLRVPADLAGRACLRLALPGPDSTWHLRAPEGVVEDVAVRGWLVVDTVLALHRAALDGLGPALLPDWLAGADLAARRLVDLFPDHDASAPEVEGAVWLLQSERAASPPALQAVAEFLRQRLVAA